MTAETALYQLLKLNGSQQEVFLFRKTSILAPLGTLVAIDATDQEWLRMNIPVCGYIQPKPDTLHIVLEIDFEVRNEVKGLAILRAVEILRNEGWKYHYEL